MWNALPKKKLKRYEKHFEPLADAQHDNSAKEQEKRRQWSPPAFLLRFFPVSCLFLCYKNNFKKVYFFILN